MKNKRVWILAGAIVLIVAAFLPLNFRMAVSDMQVIPRIMVTKLDGYPDRPGPDAKISLVLDGEGPLAEALQNALMEKWDTARMGQLQPAQKHSSTYPGPVLLIKAGSPGMVWTPFFAMRRFSIQAGYATDGDPSFMETLDAEQIYLRSSDPWVVYLYNEYEGVDRSFGLISRPGYDAYLADYFAGQIIEALKGPYNIQDPGGG
jgi:hypothetical protein